MAPSVGERRALGDGVATAGGSRQGSTSQWRIAYRVSSARSRIPELLEAVRAMALDGLLAASPNLRQPVLLRRP
jgi:hypothetical protein